MLSEVSSFILIPIIATMVAFAIERFGPRIGGSIAALPLVTGATLAVIAATGDVATVRTVAFHALMGGFAATVLLRVYAHFCVAHRISTCALLAMIAFVGVGTVTSPLGTKLLTHDAHSYTWLGCVWLIAIASVVFALPGKLSRTERSDVSATKKFSMKKRLAIRIGAGTLFGYATIYVNAQFGPALAGVLLALPPVALPQMLIEHRLVSGHSAREFIHGRNRNHGVQVAFFAVLCVASSEVSIAFAFALAFAISACAFAALWLTQTVASPKTA